MVMASLDRTLMAGSQFHQARLHADTEIPDLMHVSAGWISSGYGAGNTSHTQNSTQPTSIRSMDNFTTGRSTANEQHPQKKISDYGMQILTPCSEAAAHQIPPVSDFGLSGNAALSQGMMTVSPLETHLDQQGTSPIFSKTNDLGEDSCASESPKQQKFVYSANSENLWSLHQADQNTKRTQSRTRDGTAKRKRRSEDPEPGSARAIYLEKNRQAASKCRSKQKRHQEELVETARHYERKNKMLKAEVDILQSGMRELMRIVGQHTECSDDRLRLYVQREADRLAGDGRRPSALSS